MNVDPTARKEQARIRKMKRTGLSRRDTVRLAVKCPFCGAQPGEYCSGTKGLRMSHHSARYHMFAGIKKPTGAAPAKSIVASTDTEAFIAQHGVTQCPPEKAKNYGGIQPSITRKHAAAETAELAQKRLRGQRNRSHR